MTAAEEGVLLLCCRLGDPACRPLTMAKFRELGLRIRASEPSGSRLSELSRRDLTRLGYDEDEADRIVALLDREERLSDYLCQAEALGIVPITRVSPAYPRRISGKQQLSSPPVLFARGELSLLDGPSVAVVGSRQLRPENECFAQTAGLLAAREGLTLVSGNAPGADQTAQNSCLDEGGQCVVFVADRLINHEADPRILYISEADISLPFSPARALHRNPLIHMQGDKTLAAQCTYGKGGTWEGSLDNLKHGWSPLFVFDDGSDGSRALLERGASPVTALTSIEALTPSQLSLF